MKDEHRSCLSTGEATWRSQAEPAWRRGRLQATKCQADEQGVPNMSVSMAHHTTGTSTHTADLITPTPSSSAITSPSQVQAWLSRISSKSRCSSL